MGFIYSSKYQLKPKSPAKCIVSAIAYGEYVSGSPKKPPSFQVFIGLNSSFEISSIKIFANSGFLDSDTIIAAILAPDKFGVLF
ncbi:hypothetical protein RCH19_002976 [Flavobacterium sp. PL12]